MLTGLKQIKHLVVLLLLWASQKLSSYFYDFGKVKLLCGWLLLTSSLCKSPLGKTRCLGNPCFLLTGSLSIQFFDSQLTQSVRPLWFTYPSLCSTCVTYGILCHAIGHQVLPTQPLPREAEDFPKVERHSHHVPLLSYLIYLSPKEVYW